MSVKTLIRFENFTKHYKGKTQPAVDKLNLEIYEGEIFGYLGPNGAGKTTTLKAIFGFIHFNGGDIWLYDERLPQASLNRYIGYLPEKVAFPKYLTAKEVLMYYGGLSGISAKELTSNIPRVLAMVGIPDVANIPIEQFSKGMTQRLGIAQSLLHDPKILFWDEPDSGLDPLGQVEMRQLIIDLRGQGKTIFLSTHILAEMEKVCDRISIMKNGRLVSVRSMCELLATNKTYKLKFNTVSDNLKENLGRIGWIMGVDGGEITIAIADESKLSQLPELLQKSGCTMLSLSPVRQTLEDIFLEAIRE